VAQNVAGLREDIAPETGEQGGAENAASSREQLDQFTVLQQTEAADLRARIFDAEEAASTMEDAVTSGSISTSESEALIAAGPGRNPASDEGTLPEPLIDGAATSTPPALDERTTAQPGAAAQQGPQPQAPAATANAQPANAQPTASSVPDAQEASQPSPFAAETEEGSANADAPPPDAASDPSETAAPGGEAGAGGEGAFGPIAEDGQESDEGPQSATPVDDAGAGGEGSFGPIAEGDQESDEGPQSATSGDETGTGGEGSFGPIAEGDQESDEGPQSTTSGDETGDEQAAEDSSGPGEAANDDPPGYAFGREGSEEDLDVGVGSDGTRAQSSEEGSGSEGAAPGQDGAASTEADGGVNTDPPGYAFGREGSEEDLDVGVGSDGTRAQSSEEGSGSEGATPGQDGAASTEADGGVDTDPPGYAFGREGSEEDLDVGVGSDGTRAQSSEEGSGSERAAPDQDGAASTEADGGVNTDPPGYAFGREGSEEDLDVGVGSDGTRAQPSEEGSGSEGAADALFDDMDAVFDDDGGGWESAVNEGEAKSGNADDDPWSDDDDGSDRGADSFDADDDFDGGASEGFSTDDVMAGLGKENMADGLF